jgi:hypothetical protein
MSRWDWSKSVESFFEIDCDRRGCGFLTSVLDPRLGLRRNQGAQGVSANDRYYFRRGSIPKGKGWRWRIWFHNGD